MKKVAIIGGGFAGLSSACYLAKAGYDVSIFEKNSTVGGRNPVISSALHSYAGVPNASTALTQPEPITKATS